MVKDELLNKSGGPLKLQLNEMKIVPEISVV
jgi:hypothetical protein